MGEYSIALLYCTAGCCINAIIKHDSLNPVLSTTSKSTKNNDRNTRRVRIRRVVLLYTRYQDDRKHCGVRSRRKEGKTQGLETFGEHLRTKDSRGLYGTV